MITISTVRSSKEKKLFINLPWHIYRDNSLWVPPLKSSVSKLLDRKKHPFWKFSDGELFLAWQDNRVVGRIAAIIDNNSNAYHNEKLASWGFFECENNPEAALLLFQTVEKWAKDRGMSAIRGPLNPSTNYEIGLLVQGFDNQPTLMMPYNPSYYIQLLHGAGYKKEKDLLSYRLVREHTLPDWIHSLSEKMSSTKNVTIRFPKKWTVADIQELFSIYHDCWKDNWGFVPTTEEEEIEHAKNLLPIIKPGFAFFIDYLDEPVGICVMVPDYNILLKRLNGQLGISALIKKLLYESEITGVRALLFGIKEKYRMAGVPLAAVKYINNFFMIERTEYNYAELGWILEDNEAMTRLLEDIGLKTLNRFRVFKKDFI